MSVTVSLSGDGIEFERDVPENVALKILELSMSNGASTTKVDGDEDAVDEDDVEEGNEDDQRDALPDNFFSRLSSKQEALLQVLLESDERISSTELRQRMEDEHGKSVGGGRGLAGILAGFTRKYGGDFDLVIVDWGDYEGIYYLNPDRPEYIAELEEYFSD
jgi:hypothetical protein